MSTSQCLILKQKLISLYSRFVTSFHNSTNNNYRRPSESVLTNDRKSALTSLRNDPNIVITRPDKGNGVCILNHCDYVSKMLTILNDQSKFKPSNHDTSLSNLTKFQRSLYYLKSKTAILNDVYEKIYPTATTTPSLYGLPKLHKPGIPLRPILSCSGSFNYECARWLSHSLNNLRQHPTNIPDTFQFLTKLSDISYKISQTKLWFHLMSKASLHTFPLLIPPISY